MGRRKTTEEFILESNVIHSNKYTYANSVYMGAKTKLPITCALHGDFTQTPDSHLRGNGCPKCAGNNYKTTEEFIDESEAVHGKLYSYALVEYVNAYSKVKIVCDEHGEFLQAPCNHIKGHGCPKCSGKSLTTEEFKQKAEVVHCGRYDYSKVEYINGTVKVRIICKVHGEFTQTPELHLQGHGCQKCGIQGRPNTTKSFIDAATKLHGTRYDYSQVNYIKAIQKVKIICREHGEFLQTPNQHLGEAGCPKCVGRNKTTEEFIREATIIHGGKYRYNLVHYTKAITKVKIVCPYHGIFAQTPNSHLAGVGCPKCAGRNKTTEEFISEAKNIHSEKYDYSQINYTKAASKVKIVCYEHGEFLQSPIKHLSGQGCPNCAKSGFDSSKEAIFYVYAFNNYIGFGISNNFKARNKVHLCNFKKKGIDATLTATYNMSGELAQSLERHIKQTLDIVDSGIDGFKTEALHIDDLGKLYETLKGN